MIKSRSFVILILAGLIIFTTLWFRPLSRDGAINASLPEEESGPSKSIQSTLAQPVELAKIEPSAEGEKLLPSQTRQCHRYAHDVAALDLARFAELLMEGREELPSECGNRWTEILSGFKSWLEKHCIDQAEIPLEQEMKCLAQIQMYRANLIAFATEQESVTALTSPILINKAMASFYDQGWNDDNEQLRLTAELDKVADELLARREFENFAMKLKLSARINSKNASEARQIIDQARQMQMGDDAELHEAAIYVEKLGSDDPTFRQTMRHHVRSHPEDALGYYYLAAVEWTLGHREASAAALRAALQLDPENERFQVALARVAKAEFGDRSVFYIKFEAPFE